MGRTAVPNQNTYSNVVHKEVIIPGKKNEDLRKEIMKRYNVGQVVNMRKRNVVTGEITKRFKVKIKAFYPYYVLAERNGFNTCYQYNDFKQLIKV